MLGIDRKPRGNGVPECQFLFLLVSNQTMVATKNSIYLAKPCRMQPNVSHNTLSLMHHS